MSVTNPTKIGWYFTSSEGPVIVAAHCRLWNGEAWSAPVHRDDPAEHWERAGRTPSEASEVFWTENVLPSVPSREAGQALTLLQQAADHMRERAKAYDQPGGERSMARAVAAFNAVSGKRLDASDGWLLMALLKMVRDQSAAGGHADSQEDLVAYAALYGESRRAA